MVKDSINHHSKIIIKNQNKHVSKTVVFGAFFGGLDFKPTV